MDLSTTEPLRIDLDGSPFWRFEDGTLLPVIAGAQEGGEGGSGGEGGQASGGASGAQGAGSTGAGASQGDGQGGASGSGDGSGATTEGGDDKGGKGGKVTFTPEQQAHIDDLIKKNTGKSKAAAEKEFKAWLDQQAMSETDRLKAEKEAADALVAEAKREALTARIETTAERLAIDAGVPAKRVEKFLKVVGLDDLDDLTDDGKPDKTAIKRLIDAELTDDPAWKNGSNGSNGSSGGEFNQDNQPGQLSRDDLKGMSPQEIAKAKKDGRLKVLLGQT